MRAPFRHRCVCMARNESARDRYRSLARVPVLTTFFCTVSSKKVYGCVTEGRIRIPTSPPLYLANTNSLKVAESAPMSALLWSGITEPGAGSKVTSTGCSQSHASQRSVTNFFFTFTLLFHLYIWCRVLLSSLSLSFFSVSFSLSCMLWLFWSR